MFLPFIQVRVPVAALFLGTNKRVFGRIVYSSVGQKPLEDLLLSVTDLVMQESINDRWFNVHAGHRSPL